MSGIDLSGTIHHELQSKVISERINLLETCMENLCETFGKVARKNARLRDASDHMVSVINEYSGKEKINSSSKKGLVNFSSFLSAVEDYRHAMIERIEKKIIQPMSKYQEYLRTSRKQIKSTITIRDKEKQKSQRLNELMQKQPDDGRNIAQAEANAEGAKQRVANQDRILAEAIDQLEQKKLTDMKKYFCEYAHIQMIFHAKALEMLTIAYKEILGVDTNSDLEEFRNTFTQSNFSSFSNSRMNLNSSFQQQRNPPTDYNNRNRQYGNSLPSSPNRARSSNNPRTQQYDTPADIIARRARSNDSLSNRSDYNPQSNYPNMNSPNSKNNANMNQQYNRNNKNYRSAPHLNQDVNIQDMTDDSDQE